VYGDKIFNYSRTQTEALFSVYQNQLATVLDRYNGCQPQWFAAKVQPMELEQPEDIRQVCRKRFLT